VERKAGGDRAGEIDMLNYLASPKTSIKDIHAPDVERTTSTARRRRIVAVQDTTEVNFAGRDKRRKGLCVSAGSRPRRAITAAAISLVGMGTGETRKMSSTIRTSSPDLNQPLRRRTARDGCNPVEVPARSCNTGRESFAKTGSKVL
jgi:hypothetical protein